MDEVILGRTLIYHSLFGREDVRRTRISVRTFAGFLENTMMEVMMSREIVRPKAIFTFRGLMHLMKPLRIRSVQFYLGECQSTYTLQKARFGPGSSNVTSTEKARSAKYMFLARRPGVTQI
jgi:hypothetical protein